ncbi:MAG: BrnT family toxin [Candidatus Binataceae bacterium]
MAEREAEFEWNPGKAEANLRKHGVEFLDAVIVFGDDRAITLVDEHPNEDRFVTFGIDAYGRVLAVAYAIRGNAVRIISARKAAARERAQYEDQRL